MAIHDFSKSLQPFDSLDGDEQQPTDGRITTTDIRDLVAPLLGTNLPPQLTSFVGRRDTLDALGRLLRGGERLLTLVGPAGAGKTRTAIECGRRNLGALLDEHPGGVWLCDLTEARTIDGICSVMGTVLNVPIAEGTTPEENVASISQALQGRGRILLLLDNFEQVVQHAGATVGRWLVEAPQVRVVATSRERLGLRGERVFPLQALTLPQGEHGCEHSEAVQLFVERARAVRHAYQLSAADRASVAEIVQRLDGMPLAIELAASRMHVLGAPQIARHLAKRFELLVNPRRDVSERQATMKGAIDWSWRLLRPWERSALCQCAAFRGGFSLEAAYQLLTPVQDRDAPNALEMVQALCDRSLVHTFKAPGRSGELRYRLYESVRAYAVVRLKASGQSPDVLRRHAAYYLALARRLRAEEMQSGTPALSELGAELENLLAVHRRMLNGRVPDDSGNGALEIALALAPLLLSQGPLALSRDLLERALDKDPDAQHPDAQHPGAPSSPVREEARAVLMRVRSELAARPSVPALCTKVPDATDEMPPMASDDALVVSRSARRFRPPHGTLVSLATRRAPRLILQALADARDKDSTRAMTGDDLLDAGWPGERVHPEAGAARVYTAVATLRRMGLRGVLIRRDDGYLLDPRIELVREQD
jgi:predicted ATPase